MISESTTLRRKLLWLIGVRFVTITILLGSVVLVQLRTPGLWPVGPLFFLVGLSYAFTVAFLMTLSQVEHRRWVIDVQLGTDAVERLSIRPPPSAHWRRRTTTSPCAGTIAHSPIFFMLARGLQQ